jgi:hypothetical protein
LEAPQAQIDIEPRSARAQVETASTQFDRESGERTLDVPTGPKGEPPVRCGGGRSRFLPGRPRGLLPRGSHRSGRADFPHPVPQATVLLRPEDRVDDTRYRQRVPPE